MADTTTFPGMILATTPYKQANGHDILVGIITPTNLVPGKHPVIVRFHGGFLVSSSLRLCFDGYRLTMSLKFTGGHAFWFQPWLIEYARIHSAIIVGIDYRLMPEANGLDMMEDLNDLGFWMFNKFQLYLGNETQVDLDKILIEGDSAGKLTNSFEIAAKSHSFVQEAILPYSSLSIWEAR